ncbi:hypothetical protein MASR2M47_21470 [Draconibacterium sp.]
MKNLKYILIVLLLEISFGKITFAGYHFKPMGDFSSAMNINILEAKINGIDLEAGDEIGIFDGNICVGSIVLTKNLLVMNDTNIAAAKAGADDSDTQFKDGYIKGNPISFKMYDTSAGEEITTVTATFVSSKDLSIINPSPTFNPDVTGFVSLIATHNRAPKANAGADQEINEQENGQLDGTLSSDYENSNLTYTWNDIDKLGLNSTNVAQPTFTTPTVNATTNYRVVLIVNDGEKFSQPDTVIVTVKRIDLPPVANAGADFEIVSGGSGKLNGNGSKDPHGLTLTFSWTIEPADFEPATPNGASTVFIAPIVTNDKEYKAILTVSNSILLIDKDTVMIKVLKTNLKPIANAGSDQVVNEGTQGELDGSASNSGEGGPIIYSWTSGFLVLDDASSAKPVFTAPEVKKDTTVTVILTINDGKQTSTPDEVKITIKNVNKMPVANAGVDFIVNEGDKITLNGSASYDPDGDAITYNWSAQGYFISSANLAMAKTVAPEVEKDTIVPFVLTINDGKLNSQPDTVWVTVKQVNKAPIIAEIPNNIAEIGYKYSVNISVSDADMLDTISIFSDDLPSWLSLIDNGTGSAMIYAQSVPRLDSLLGTHKITVKATDGIETVETSFELTVSVKTGIAGEITFNAAKFYPNPTKGLITVEFNRLPEPGSTIKVYNYLGQTVQEKTVNAQTNQLDLSNCPSGTYYIKTVSGNDSHTEKVILR